jgi:hypothetical protein
MLMLMLMLAVTLLEFLWSLLMPLQSPSQRLLLVSVAAIGAHLLPCRFPSSRPGWKRRQSGWPRVAPPLGAVLAVSAAA